MSVEDGTIEVNLLNFLNKIDKFEVQIISEDAQSMRKGQGKVIFTVENTGQSSFKIPSDQLSTLMKNSTYSIKVSV